MTWHACCSSLSGRSSNKNFYQGSLAISSLITGSIRVTLGGETTGTALIDRSGHRFCFRWPEQRRVQTEYRDGAVAGVTVARDPTGRRRGGRVRRGGGASTPPARLVPHTSVLARWPVAATSTRSGLRWWGHVSGGGCRDVSPTPPLLEFWASLINYFNYFK